MSSKIIVTLILFVSFTMQAKFYEGTIYFNSGEERTGFIGSFMENNIWKKLKPFNKIEDRFNLSDKTVKFKSSRKADSTEKFSIDEISRIVLKNGSTSSSWKPLYVGGVNGEGELEKSKNKIWLPLLSKGKINLYGFGEHTVVYQGGMASGGTTHYYFIHHRDRDYAIYPLSKLSMMELLNNEIVMNALVKELQYLVPDCQFLLDGYIDDIKRSANKKERKLLKKEYKQRRKDIYSEFNEKNPNADKMFKIFVNYYWMYYEYMDSYNNDCK